MKKISANAVIAAIGLVWGGSVFAGSIVAPIATTKYAVESLVATTDVTLPTVTYRMGVTRTNAQDFTVIITPSSGATFTAASCAAAVPTISFSGAGAGAFTASVKRASSTECAYEIDVTTPFNGTGVTDNVNLNFAGLAFDTHSLNVSGTIAGITIALKDLGETAFIDNSGSLNANLATSGNALTMTAVADSNTRANVNDASGPLFGFLADANVPTDSATVAAASFVIRNNNDGTNDFKKADGTTSWNCVVDCATAGIAATVSGNFAQLKTDGFTVTTSVGVAPVATVSGTNATFSILPSNLNAAGAGSSTTVTTSFETARNASMGTARTFGVSTVGNVTTGAAVSMAGNSSWWSWGANASQLMTSYFTTSSAFLSRFFLLNTGSSAVTYSADCLAENGVVVSYGAGRTGTLIANGQTAINARDICTFSTATRGAIIFTVNAPINTVKGSYQFIDQVSLNGTVMPLVRPYNQVNTTE